MSASFIVDYGRVIFNFESMSTNFESSFCPRGKGIMIDGITLAAPLEVELVEFDETSDYPTFKNYLIEVDQIFECAVLMMEPDRETGKRVIKMFLDTDEDGWIEAWYRF